MKRTMRRLGSRRFPLKLRRYEHANTVGDHDTPDHAIRYALHRSRSQDAVIRVYDAAGKVIETHERKGNFKKW